VTGIVANPATFSAAAASTSAIGLTWTKNASANDVMVVYSPNTTFGTPANGTTYAAGSTLPGGGTVLYCGDLTTFSHTGLNPSTTCYYKAFSYNTAHDYSAGMTANATTLCSISGLPLAEVFATSILPACWTKQISGTNATDKWTVSSTANAGGVAYEMKSTYQSANPGITRLVTPPINTLGIPSLNLSFKHKLDAYGTGCTLRIQSSTNGTTWTNEAWNVVCTATNVGPETVSTTILSNVNAPATMIAFTIEGNLFQYDYWYIDDVTVTSGCTSTLPVSLTIEASALSVVAGTPVTFTATPANGGSTPVYQWFVNGTPAGTNSSSYTYVPANNDAVHCVLTSNAMCVTGNPATSAVIVMEVTSVPATNTLQNMVISGTQCFDALQTILVAGSGTTFTVQESGIVTLIAGESIFLYPGTLVNEGGYLYGYIAPSGPWCSMAPVVETLTGLETPAMSQPGGLIRVYPNPTTGAFQVALESGFPEGNWTVEVSNMQGNVVLQKAFSGVRQGVLSLAGKPSGVYLVRVTSSGATAFSRIVRL
jgi:hypothetical protein